MELRVSNIATLVVGLPTRSAPNLACTATESFRDWNLQRVLW